MRRLRRLYDLLPRRPRLAHGDIFVYGAAFEPRFLQHHTVVFPQRLSRDAADILPVDRNAAAVHVVKAHQQIDERGLSATGGTDDGDPLAGRHAKGKPLDERFGFIVGKAHVFKGNFSLRGREFLVPRVGNLRGHIDELEDAFAAGEGVLKLGDDAGDLVEGFGVLGGVRQEFGESADRERR